MTLDTARLFIGWLIRSKLNPSGTISDSSARPTVVSTNRVAGATSSTAPPFVAGTLTLTLACRSTASFSYAL